MTSAIEIDSDVIVLGAGGAGLFCAATAAQRGKRVVVLDHADQPGKKILISGGGRCNFTNLEAGPDRFLSENRHFAKSALRRYTAADFIALVDSHGIAWHEKTLGQLFCDGSAKQIVRLLLDECAKGDCDIRLAEIISGIAHSDAGFRVSTGAGTYAAPTLVVATGGPSIPKMGATGFAYDIARQFQVPVVTPRPALVPFTLDAEQRLFTSLAGVATDVVARVGKTAFAEACLFTHKGLSGPAILQVSSYWAPGQEVAIDFFPGRDRDWLLAQKQERPRTTLKAALARSLPDRLAATLSERLGADADLGNTPDKTLRGASERLARWIFRPSGTEGFAKAEVTAGGVDTSALSSKTMAAKTLPGLYFVGEAVDVTGWLGGYNFQWAWSSGYAAGVAIAET
jgi:predicted Rossmann fold flavoprotein